MEIITMKRLVLALLFASVCRAAVIEDNVDWPVFMKRHRRLTATVEKLFTLAGNERNPTQ
jgi:hypothetical protein